MKPIDSLQFFVEVISDDHVSIIIRLPNGKVKVFSELEKVIDYIRSFIESVE